MKTLWRAIRPYLILTLLGGALIWPLVRPDVPCTDDGQLYYYQAAAMRYGVEHGVVYSRWLSDAALGYGIPLLNYREPLPRYLVLALALAGVPIPLALNLLSAAALLVAGWGTYRLARRVFGSAAAGYVAGIAMMAGPYLLMDIYRRGALPETVALALIPWTLAAFWNAATSPHRGAGPVMTAAAAWAAVILSHNISALLVAAPLLGYAVLLGWIRNPTPSPCKGRAATFGRSGVGFSPPSTNPPFAARLRSLAAYLAGLGLAAFYWIPAFFERNRVQIGRATATRNNTYTFNFVGLGELFAPPTPHNPAWLNPPMQIQVGLIAAVLALVGIAVGWLAFRDRIRRAHIIGFAVWGAAALAMVLPASRPVWDAIPVLAFVQFPWRLVGLAALPVAILAGVGVGGAMEWLRDPLRPSATSPLQGFRGRQVGAHHDAPLRGNLIDVPPLGLMAGAVAAVLIAAGLPATYPPWCPMAPYPTITDVNRFEQDGLVGLDNEGSYFPVGAAMPEDSPLLADYAAGESPRRFDETTLPAGATSEADYGPLGAAIHLTTPEPFRARYLSYDFPGWRVWMDGARVPIIPEPDTGLITFDVPEGTHAITVRFGLTPLRAAALLVSALTLVILVVGCFTPSPVARGRDGVGVTPGTQSDHTPSPALPRQAGEEVWHSLAGDIILAAVGAVMLLARAAWPGEIAAPWRIARPPTPQHAVDVRFDGQVRLLGYDLENATWPADREFRVDSYWARAAEMSRDTGVAWTVVDARGIVWSVKGGIPPRGAEEAPFPTFAWPPDTYATDSQLIRLLPGTPPGSYTLAVTCYDRETLQPLAAPYGEGVTTQLPLQAVTVTWPEQPWPRDSLGIQYPVEEPVGGLTLLGYNLDREEVGPGESVLVTLFWESRVEGAEAPPAALTLDGAPVEGAALTHPAGTIPAGMTWREQGFLRIPAGTGPGAHPIGVTVEGGQPMTLATITVRPVARVFEPPPISQPVNALFGGSARLVGFGLGEDGGQLVVTLVWRAEADMPTGYTVFVHALDAAGAIIAQRDAIPGNGARPTTGWLPGEVVSDSYTLPVAPGQAAALRIGLYDAATGVRLRLTDGADSVVTPLTDGR